jgi:TPR repeat protein
MKEEIEPDILVKEAHALLQAAWNTIDDERFEQLVTWAREIIEPLAESGYPSALWLKCSLPYDAELSGELVDELHRKQLEMAAEAGNANAQFSLACELDEEPTIERSAALFEKAAESGHAYAMWCHGLNLLGGRGIEKNKEEGLSFINRSAELKFEGAIKFMAEACASGTYGQEKSEEASALWWKKLSDPGLVHY